MTFPCDMALAPGRNGFWISVTLSDTAGFDRPVAARFASVTIPGLSSTAITDHDAVTAKQVGVAVRRAGQDGVHTARIPGLATTNDGTLIAVYDLRRGKSGDLPGDVDVGMSRSTDGGRTWEPTRVIMDMGERSEVAATTASATPPCSSIAGHRHDLGRGARGVPRQPGSWRGIGDGVRSPKRPGQLMLVRSRPTTDVTWSKPINITRSR